MSLLKANQWIKTYNVQRGTEEYGEQLQPTTRHRKTTRMIETPTEAPPASLPFPPSTNTIVSVHRLHRQITLWPNWTPEWSNSLRKKIPYYFRRTPRRNGSSWTIGHYYYSNWWRECLFECFNNVFSCLLS